MRDKRRHQRNRRRR